MECVDIRQCDYPVFHDLLEAYYREGEDADTPQEELDSFVRMMFDMVIRGEIEGCFAENDGIAVGFCLWTVDSEGSAFSEKPGYGTILEIGLSAPYRSSGLGSELVSRTEDRFRNAGIAQCYVSAYGPAEQFWSACGYRRSGETAENGLPIMTKCLLP